MIVSVFVRKRYPRTRFAAVMCAGDGLVRNSASFEHARAISGLVVTAAKFNDPMRCWYAKISCADALPICSVSGSVINGVSGSFDP